MLFLNLVSLTVASASSSASPLAVLEEVESGSYNPQSGQMFSHSTSQQHHPTAIVAPLSNNALSVQHQRQLQQQQTPQQMRRPDHNLTDNDSDHSLFLSEDTGSEASLQKLRIHDSKSKSGTDPSMPPMSPKEERLYQSRAAVTLSNHQRHLHSSQETEEQRQRDIDFLFQGGCHD
jgi:hypothetical protein